MDTSLVIELAKILVPVGALYGAIRSDLKNLREHISGAHSLASAAHKRLDEHIDRHHTK